MWVALLVSALLLHTALYIPTYAGWLVFIFLVPLFYSWFQLRPQFWQGFVWGITFFGLHFHDLICVMSQKATHGAWPLLFCLLIAYCALTSGCWFWCVGRVVEYKAFVFVCITFAYFFLLNKAAFLPVGGGGYPFVSLLLPLACYPVLLSGIPVIGSFLMVLLIIGINMQIAQGLYYCRARSVGWTVFFLIPFIAGLALQKPETIPAWISSIAIILPNHMPCHPRAAALAINETIEHINEQSGVVLIIASEASYPFWLNENMHAIDLWRQTLDKNQQLIIGSHRKEAVHCYNSLFCVGTNGIIHHYDKKYLMPFVEYVPWPWQHASLCKNFFLKDKKEFFPNQNSSIAISAGLDLYFQPLICSDLFFGSAPRAYSCPLLCIANDGWFCTEYFPKLMVLFARLTAIEEQRELMYVSHKQGYWIGKSGQSVGLKTYPLLI